MERGAARDPVRSMLSVEANGMQSVGACKCRKNMLSVERI